jgi:hypothetical protein
VALLNRVTRAALPSAGLLDQPKQLTMKVQLQSEYTDRPLFQPTPQQVPLPQCVNLTYALLLVDTVELVATPKPEDI